ncbi:hypothetical protein SCHPADRAFT_993805 [Schizopora paradoxa]|uniref:Uncharacterized protein n=1 Tax=Schizopora paradoxa TaxID=27342 RepID=A0A0H2S1J3_9AGAM|nr:hypothetical protein SCHPADRAFT_993805 [Schizopora paradoxa]
MAVDAKLESDGLESDLREVLSSWIACKEFIPKRWKGDVETITAMSHNDLQATGVEDCYRLVSRARKSMPRLTALSNSLRELSSAIQAKSEAAEENYDAVSNMCGLIFLPNELLARIFRFVVNDEPGLDNPTRSKAAVTLSHVSEYFRSTALSCASLWSDISGGNDLDILCLSRSKDALLDVATTVGLFRRKRKPHEFVFKQSLTRILPCSGRWRSLDIMFWMMPKGARMPEGNLEISQAFRGSNVRSLESLHLKSNRNVVSTFEICHEFQHWHLPSLRHLTSVYYFPVNLPGLVNLVSLDLTIKPGEISLPEIHKELSRMKALEEISLKLRREGGFILGRRHFPSFDKAEFPRVRNIKIEMESQSPHWFDVFRVFFSSMSFPEAVDLQVKVEGTISSTIYPGEKASFLLSNEVYSIFQHDAQFPRVERFCLEATVAASDIYYMTPLEARRVEISLVIPLALLPNAKHFTLISNGCLEVYPMKYHSGELLYASALETITVRIIELATRSVASLIKRYLTEQKERRGWATFRELVVIDNSHGSDDRIKKAYAGDDALKWCERRESASIDEVDGNIID